MKAIEWVDFEKRKSLPVSLDWREFACGWGAAFINITVTYPIYKMIFRQMLHGSTTMSAFQQIRGEGLVYLYRGILPPLAQRTLSLSLMFGVYDGTKRPLIEDMHWNEYNAKIVAGITAGTVEAILMPFERVQTVLADAAYHKQFKNTPHVFQKLHADHGIKELYRGLVPILLRNGLSNSLFFVMREEAHHRLPQHYSVITQSIQEFVAGACIGAFISSVFYPLNVLKVAVQSTIGGPNRGMIVVARQIYEERGRKFSNVYKGVSINAARAFIAWGIMNVAYENLKKVFY